MRLRQGMRGHGRHGCSNGVRDAFRAMAFGRGGPEGARGWGGQGRGGRGGRRVFDSGELRLVLLKLIADQPRHGYDLIRAIEELSGGAYAPSPGVVYPTLTMLHDMGHIDEAKAEGSRKAYAITPEGAAHLAEHKAEVDALLERLAALAAMREKTDAAPIRRAMQNMRTVLHDRLSREDVDKAILHEVAAILDEAAQRIERL